MDHEWQEWTDLWQQQPLPELSVEQATKMLSGLSAKGRRQRIFLLISFGLTAISLIAMAIIFGGFCTFAGVALIILAMAMVLFQTFRHPLQAVKNVDQFSQQAFLRAQISALDQRLLLTSRYMWIYGLLLIIGINLTYLDVLVDLELFWRVGLAALVSVVMAAGFAYSIPRYQRQIRRVIDPLRQQLKSWQNH